MWTNKHNQFPQLKIYVWCRERKQKSSWSYAYFYCIRIPFEFWHYFFSSSKRTWKQLMSFLIWDIACKNELCHCNIILFCFYFLLLRFKRTWKQSMSFHYWLQLWWRRLKLLFKVSQSALILTDKLKLFHGEHILYIICSRWDWKFMLEVIGVIDVISSWYLGCFFFFLVLIVPSFSRVQTFQIDFGSRGLRS